MSFDAAGAKLRHNGGRKRRRTTANRKSVPLRRLRCSSTRNKIGRPIRTFSFLRKLFLFNRLNHLPGNKEIFPILKLLLHPRSNLPPLQKTAISFTRRELGVSPELGIVVFLIIRILLKFVEVFYMCLRFLY